MSKTLSQVNWGIIGCGDVTEGQSGPAFTKIPNSSLVAVMRRDVAKAKDYAQRHGVPKWYNDATQLIADPDVNAIYVATPPSFHEYFTLAAINAHKPVYVEKPMATHALSAMNMMKHAEDRQVKLVVAHYRRAQPLFRKIRQLLEEKAIGNVRLVNIQLYRQPLTAEELTNPGKTWRVDPKTAGGGLFHDLAPHQLDILYHFFGEAAEVTGIARNQGGGYAADDIVSGSIYFRSGVLMQGNWCFTVAQGLDRDTCEIIGTEGKIEFGFFDYRPITLWRNGKEETFSFEPLQHVQQPMIEQVVKYFRGEAPNPNPAGDGVAVMSMIDKLAGLS